MSIRSDLYRLCGRTDWRSGVAHFMRVPAFRYLIWLRLCNSRNPLIAVVARCLHRGMTNKYGVHIPPAVPIGPGLLIPHLTGIVINSTGRIGANCTLGHHVTIGSASKTAAVVEDDVYIAPHSVLVENVHIGKGATIGAGSVVVHDVAAGATVAGNPAKVISEKEPGRLIKRPWTG